MYLAMLESSIERDDIKNSFTEVSMFNKNYDHLPKETYFGLYKEAARDLASRHDRCDCKPTKDDVKRCFILEFDRDAFIIASTATKEEMLRWFRERPGWTDKQLNLKHFSGRGYLDPNIYTHGHH